jgi:NADPH-dependent glutamate synthase beta subunit-like oxidoreductase
MDMCPNKNNIREMLVTIAQSEKYNRPYEESLEKAFYIWAEKNPIPSVCGRVCPHPCETGCNRNEKDGPVGINSMERYLGDFAIDKGLPLKKVTDEKQVEKIAVVGSGPSGLSCAYQLARKGYPVTIFEAFSKPGGMLRYGIPPYRLPHNILDAEINRILDMGVDLKCDTSIGRDIPYDNLREDYSAIYVAIGAHKGRLLNIEGEDAENVLTGTEFLNKANSGQPVDIGKKVIVIGGGDTAIDAARVSRRLGAEATILYRRTRTEMPAIEEEIEGALEEGVKIEYLAAPTAFLKDNGRAKGMKCIRMELGEPDDSGRRRPVPIQGSDFEVEADCVIAAISQEPDFEGLEDLKAGPRDWIKADRMGATAMEKTYAGGDVLDLGLVVVAIFQGRMAAEAIHHNLRGTTPERVEELPVIKADKMKFDFYDPKPRNNQAVLPVEKRFQGIGTEVNLGYTEQQIQDESQRCMSCGSCFDCGTCWSYCQDQAIIKPLVKGEPYTFKMDFCQGCKKCAEECPCGFIEMV